MMMRLSVDRAGFRREVRALAVEPQRKAAMLLEAIGRETINYLRSSTSEIRPPARDGGPSRLAHPGHWADVSGQTSAAYGFTVRTGASGGVLVLQNIAEHAVHLEARDGFFVLTGVTEAGGPVEQALRRAVAEILPGWEVRR